MTITLLEISNDRSQIELTLTDAATVTSLKLWTDKTFKNFNTAIDLSSKLTNAVTQYITITLGDLNIPFFDGIYFIEVEDPDEISLDYAYILDKYRECILDKVMYTTNDNECLKKGSLDLINAYMLLGSLNIALEDRYIDEILIIINALNVYCSNDCSSCGKYNNEESLNSEAAGITTVILDGGSLD